jgi:PncC family amidohydrolase
MENLVSFLKREKMTISLAESCTGGLFAASLCAIPGISAIFQLGVVTYSNAMKNKVLKVKKRTLNKYGAVSYETVKEMLTGILNISHSDLSIAISGIAGPTGGTLEKPVGTVWIGVGDKEGGYSIKKFQFEGNRIEVQKQSVTEAVKLLKKYLWENYGKKVE